MNSVSNICGCANPSCRVNGCVSYRTVTERAKAATPAQPALYTVSPGPVLTVWRNGEVVARFDLTQSEAFRLIEDLAIAAQRREGGT